MPSLAEPFLQGVLSSKIDLVWHEIKSMLLEALQYADGKYTVDDIYQKLTSAQMQLWVVYHNHKLCAFCITQIFIYPTEKRLGILFASGRDVYEWIHLNEIIKDFATTKGCSAVEIYGRPGWEKILRPFGYEKIHTVLKVELPKVH
jgi:hypothetical protein